MLILAIIEAVALIAVVAMFLVRDDRRERLYREERNELQNRIAVPKAVIPPQEERTREIVQPEPDDFNLAGVILTGEPPE